VDSGPAPVRPRSPRSPIITAQQEQGLREYGTLIVAKLKHAEGLPLTAKEASYVSKRGISVMSGQGTGKDAWASWIILHFVFCMRRCKVLCTAPAGLQLKSVLWTEIHKWLSTSNIKEAIVHQSEKVFFKEEGGKQQFAIPRTIQKNSSPEEQAETLAGLHEDYMLYVVDEASGVPDAVYKPIEGSMTGRCNLALVIFNPTKHTGYAFKTQTEWARDWVCLHWDAEESELVSKTQIASMEAKYGRESNQFRVRVKGLPPRIDPDVLIPYEWAIMAVERDLEADPLDPYILGVDVGRYGDDPSVILRRQGPIVADPILSYTGHDTEEVAKKVMDEIYKWEPICTCIDVIGVGAGVYDKIKHVAKCIPVAVSEKAPRNPERFSRLRDELWWSLRERFEQGTIKIPNDTELIGELTTIKYNFARTSSDKLKIESKRELRDRGLASPNKADALCFTEFGQVYTTLARKYGGQSAPRRMVMAGWKVQ
jgi:phage terminase large subunit